MLERILVPLDGSAIGEEVLPELRRLLRLHDAEVILFRAALSPPLSVHPSFFREILAGAEEYLRGIQNNLVEQGARARSVARFGPADTAILDVARETDATMIAMSTHGRTGLRRLVMGSVAEAVLRRSPIPVFIVRAGTEGDPHRPIRNVLVALDGTERALAAVRPAIELARPFLAAITLCHGGAPTPPVEAQLRAAGEQVGAAGLAPTAIALTGRPSDVILRVAGEQGADLIVMTSYGEEGKGVTEAVLRHASVPVLVVGVPVLAAA